MELSDLITEYYNDMIAEAVKKNKEEIESIVINIETPVKSGVFKLIKGDCHEFACDDSLKINNFKNYDLKGIISKLSDYTRFQNNEIKKITENEEYYDKHYSKNFIKLLDKIKTSFLEDIVPVKELINEANYETAKKLIIRVHECHVKYKTIVINYAKRLTQLREDYEKDLNSVKELSSLAEKIKKANFGQFKERLCACKDELSMLKNKKQGIQEEIKESKKKIKNHELKIKVYDNPYTRLQSYLGEEFNPVKINFLTPLRKVLENTTRDRDVKKIEKLMKFNNEEIKEHYFDYVDYKEEVEGEINKCRKEINDKGIVLKELELLCNNFGKQIKLLDDEVNKVSNDKKQFNKIMNYFNKKLRIKK